MEADYAQIRKRMVNEQLLERDIKDPRVLQAMSSVERHLFVPPEYRKFAYADGPLPIGDGQTISQPYIVASMTQLLALKGGERVLEVGTGSGYQAAVLGQLASEVHTLERYPELAEKAAQRLAALDYTNVYVHAGDGTLGWPQAAPYQAILITAAAPFVPQPLLDQLDENGRLVIPVGGVSGQTLECWDRHGEDFTHEAIMPVAFVPLRGQYGWTENRWR